MTVPLQDLQIYFYHNVLRAFAVERVAYRASKCELIYASSLPFPLSTLPHHTPLPFGADILINWQAGAQLKRFFPQKVCKLIDSLSPAGCALLTLSVFPLPPSFSCLTYC